MEEPNEAVSSSRVNIVDINENASTQYSGLLGLVIQVSHPAHSAQIKTTKEDLEAKFTKIVDEWETQSLTYLLTPYVAVPQAFQSR